MTSKEILDIQFYSTDLKRSITIREYLKKILIVLFIVGDEFSGKRPFGNSGWKQDLEVALIQNNIIEGSLDDDGFVATSEGFESVILSIIEEL